MERGGRQSIKTVGRGIKTADRTTRHTTQTAGRGIKTANRAARQSVKAAGRPARAVRQASVKSAQAAKKAAQAARETAKAAAKTAKAAVKATIAAIKGIIAAVKSLVAAIAAGGWVAVAIVLVVCLVGLLVGSAFGIFLGNDIEPEDGLTVRQAVMRINREYHTKIESIIDDTPDLNNSEITVNGSKRTGLREVWKEVLAVYAAKQHSQALAIAFDEAKLGELRGVFWDMVSIAHRTVDVTIEVEVTDPDTGVVTVETVVKKNLYISVSSKKHTDMANLYGFDDEQRAVLKELLSPEFEPEWRRLLYGASGGNLDIVEVAASQIGNVGGRPYWSWYGFSHRIEWCACFVSWCANECGFIEAGIIPKFSSCTSGGRAWFQAQGQWQEPGYVPEPGQLIFFDWHNSGICNHVGIVESVENGVIYTIEGNSGDRVRRNFYSVNSVLIAGFGVPEYG